MHDTTIIMKKLLQIRKRLIKDEMNIYTNLVYIFTYRIVFIILILLSYHVLYITTCSQNLLTCAQLCVVE